MKSKTAFFAVTSAIILHNTARAKPPTLGTHKLASSNLFYSSNRAPLLASALVKLPVGAITPQRWLRGQLRLMADGFPGHLPDVSAAVKFEGNAWTSPKGEGAHGWEEVPYWLRGYGDLGYVLGDKRIKADFEKWTDAILSSQRPDGYFGPRDNAKNFDLWPNMLALYALRTRYEATGDKRVLPFMLGYCRWLQTIPPDKYLPGSWQKARGGDNLDSIYWLYNRTGQAWLLNLATFNHDRTQDWTTGVHDLHGVNFAQSFREPATYYQQAHDNRYLQATTKDYDDFWGTYGQVPGGMYGADENARPGYTGPRQGAETCAMVEAMFSHEVLESITGDPVWADRCEDIAFNSLPAALTADYMGLHYLTAPNMVQLDRTSKAPLLQNGGVMLSYDANENNYHCCQHNVIMGWPYFAEHLWMATPDNGLAAVLYAPAIVTAKAGDGSTVRIVETTDYPFDETINLRVFTPKTVRFPLLLRVPGWCNGATVSINGRKVPAAKSSGGWIHLARDWKSGDNVRLTLPMPVRVKTWPGNRDAGSVYRGPLAFSLQIGEKTQRYGGSDKYPATEVLPVTPWNYGLVLDKSNPAQSVQVAHPASIVAGQPFTLESAPITLKVRGKRIPEWGQEPNGLVQEIQAGPVKSDQPTEDLTLVPMGAARLRIAAFPLIGDGPDAKAWVALDKGTTFTYSHLNGGDATLNLSDTSVPKNSADKMLPRFTWWDHKGSEEWVQYEWDKPRHIQSVDVFWYDDTGTGDIRLPASWRLQWWDGKDWQSVQNAAGSEVKSSTAFGARLDAFNHVSFDAVQTTRLRLTAQLQKDYSAGILAWRVSE